MQLRHAIRLSRRHLALTGVVALLLGVLITAGLWLAAWGLQQSLRVPINAYLRTRTLAFLSEQNVEGLTITFPALDLSLVRRRLLIRDLKIRYDRREGARYTRFSATSPLITIEGLRLSDLILHRNLRLQTIRISEPLLARYQESPDTGEAAPHAAPEPEVGAETQALAEQVPSLDSVIYGLVDNWVPDDLRQTRINQIAVTGATLVSTTKRAGHASRDSTAGLDFIIRGLGLDSARQRFFESTELSAGYFVHLPPGGTDSLSIEGIAFRLDRRDTVLAIREFRSSPAPGRLAIYLAGFHHSERERAFSLDTLAIEPVESDSILLRRPSLRRTRVRLNVARLRGTRIELKALIERRINGGNIGVGLFRLDVLSDRRVDPPAKAPVRRKAFWPQRLADLDWKLQLDTLRFDDGSLRYAELKAERPRPAVIWFSDISATITGLSNARPDTSGPARAVVQASATFMDEAKVSLRMEVPVAHQFELIAEGRLADLPAPALNSFLLVSNGIRIKGGRVDKATFRFTVANRRALGTLTAMYDSLDIDLVDRKTRSQNLGQKFKSFVAGAFLVRSSNLPDKNGVVRSAEIDYRYGPGETFWGGFWKALRSGITGEIRK